MACVFLLKIKCKAYVLVIEPHLCGLCGDLADLLLEVVHLGVQQDLRRRNMWI